MPRDYLWMYPAILTALGFVLLASCPHERVAPAWRPLSRAGVCFAALGAGALGADYAIQLTVLQPALLAGENAGLSPLSQYNPHGVFIALENVGYAAQGLALLCLGTPLIRQPARLGRAAAYAFVDGGAATLVLLVVFGAVYRARLDYRFEVVAIGVAWLVLIVGGALQAVQFGGEGRRRSQQRS